ncbi:MAG TPA: class I SAM-dependent methyltransferase [Acidobacteriota bacterium]|nr:class I SAM-dependent methyltransferase [Acidobacteriota bacterium]
MDSFATVARYYNRMSGYPGRIDNLVELIAPWIERWHPQSVLDAGCGGGALMLALRRLGVEVVGLDASDAMLQLARANASERGHEFVFVSATFAEAGTRFPGRFDAVFALGNALVSPENDREMDDSLRGLHDALRPGGHLLLQCLNLIPFYRGAKTLISHRRDEDTHFLRFAVPAGERLLFTVAVVEPDAVPHVHTGWWQLWDAPRMTERLKSTGFAEIEIYGGIDRSDFDGAQSTDLVLSAKRSAGG